MKRTRGVLSRATIVVVVVIGCVSIEATRDVSQGLGTPPGTPMPTNPCIAPRAPSVPPIRTVNCPYTYSAVANSEWTKLCDEEHVGYCRGQCLVTLDQLVVGDPIDYPYCDAGGPNADPYHSGCRTDPTNPPMYTQLVNQEPVTNFYDSAEECEADLPNINCGSLAQRCADIFEDGEPEYVMFVTGACCELPPDGSGGGSDGPGGGGGSGGSGGPP